MQHPSVQFLNRLSSTNKFLFQTFDERGNDYKLTKTFYGNFEDFRGELLALNKAGAGVFVTVNKTKGNRRRKEDIIEGRAVWQEDDANSSKAPQLEPHLVVCTSPGHYHRYWLTSTDNLTSWQQAQTKMVTAYGSDPNAADVSRVLRLPGFYNVKRSCPVTLQSVSNADNYSWEDILAMLELNSPREEEAAAEAKNQLEDYIRQIKAGEHLHGPLRAIMLINANNGVDQQLNKLMCTSFIEMCPDVARKRKALADLDGMLLATYRKLKEEGDDEEPITLSASATSKSDLAWPPGLMGELSRAANDFFVIPNRTAAVMTSLGLIAGIAGRKYNVSSGGLNLYITIMMPTGAGKDSIRKFCQRVLMDKKVFGTNGLTFLGPQNFTGPKALLTELQTRPSMLCVMTEAGLLYKTDSGDKSGLTRVILQAYTSSGQYELIEPERYSTQQDSIGAVYAPALSIINEATPVTLLSELQQRESINTGELPRMWVFMLAGKKPYANPTPHKLSISDNVADSLKQLLDSAYSIQNADAPREVNHLALPDDFLEVSYYYTDCYNELIDSEPNKAIMYSRAAHKVLKTAAVVTVLNNPRATAISQEAWQWAQHLFDYEISCIEPIVNSDDKMGPALEKAATIIYRLLKHQYKGAACHVPLEFAQRNMITESPFRQAAANIATITRCGQSSRYSSPRSGAKVILQYLVDEGYLDKVSIPTVCKIREGKRGKLPVAYRVTPQLADYIKGLDIDFNAEDELDEAEVKAKRERRAHYRAKAAATLNKNKPPKG